MSHRSLGNKRVLLTGASSGIGKALAEELASQGARLALVARNREKIAELAQDLIKKGCEVIPIQADLTIAADREKVIAEITAKWGSLDLLINNAGIAASGHFSTSNEKILRDIFEINFFAPVELIRLAIPILSQGNDPVIVNISSMCGRKGIPAWPEYSASKFALCGITESLRGELQRFGIEILLMIPGLTKSNLRRNMIRCDAKMEIDLDRGMEANDLAKGIIHSVLKDRSETVFGSDARWMLRMQRWFPRLLDRLLARKVRKLYRNQ